jgi:asparagine synthase (glutamine-hydrolysing)
MCGIAGIIQKKTSSMDLQQSMLGMLDKIQHRGPDGEGIMIDAPLALGHRRLAILDLSTDGIQPMSSACQNFSIIFNGEIYNYLEIKTQLIQKGHQFSNKTDTEVILKAYQEWGEECVQYFNGMWAFCIFDKQKNILFCSRDRFGVKPFYFINQAEHFIFCSEIKGLTQFLSHRTARTDALIDYILTSKTDHDHLTFFHGIEKLPASHNLIYDLKTHSIKIKRYYELKPQSSIITAENYMHTLEDAITLRLRSDVEVGTCLSGGLDSSTVASLAGNLYQHQSQKSFSAITAISEQASNDESHFAKAVVNHCKLHWICTKPSYQQFNEKIKDIIYIQEEPFSSPSIVMQYYVMQAARQAHIPVLLDGQGGDETLLGYGRYLASHALDEYKKAGLKGLLKGIQSICAQNSRLSILKTAQYFFGTHLPNFRYQIHRLEHRYLAKEHLQAPAHLHRYAKAAQNLFDLQKLEIESTNLPALLRFEDKNSMAHSIETRLPFLDYRLVELALSLPFESKIHQGWTKYLLRKGIEQKLPQEVVWRKNKFGFEAPEQIWLAKHQNIMLESIQKSSLLQSICQYEPMKKNLSMRTLWRLYTIALWEKQFAIQGIR